MVTALRRRGSGTDLKRSGECLAPFRTSQLSQRLSLDKLSFNGPDKLCFPAQLSQGVRKLKGAFSVRSRRRTLWPPL